LVDRSSAATTTIAAALSVICCNYNHHCCKQYNTTVHPLSLHHHIKNLVATLSFWTSEQYFYCTSTVANQHQQRRINRIRIEHTGFLYRIGGCFIFTTCTATFSYGMSKSENNINNKIDKLVKDLESLQIEQQRIVHQLKQLRSEQQQQQIATLCPQPTPVLKIGDTIRITNKKGKTESDPDCTGIVTAVADKRVSFTTFSGVKTWRGHQNVTRLP
jgi:cell division protein FtsB